MPSYAIVITIVFTVIVLFVFSLFIFRNGGNASRRSARSLPSSEPAYTAHHGSPRAPPYTLTALRIHHSGVPRGCGPRKGHATLGTPPLTKDCSSCHFAVRFEHLAFLFGSGRLGEASPVQKDARRTAVALTRHTPAGQGFLPPPVLFCISPHHVQGEEHPQSPHCSGGEEHPQVPTMSRGRNTLKVPIAHLLSQTVHYTSVITSPLASICDYVTTRFTFKRAGRKSRITYHQV